MQIEDKITIVYVKKGIEVRLSNKLAFFQAYLKSPNSEICDTLYTYFYVLHLLKKFGLK